MKWWLSGHSTLGLELLQLAITECVIPPVFFPKTEGSLNFFSFIHGYQGSNSEEADQNRKTA